jgi:hypothetical protein
MKITGNKMKRKEKYHSVRIVVSKYHRNGSKIDTTNTYSRPFRKGRHQVLLPTYKMVFNTSWF